MCVSAISSSGRMTETNTKQVIVVENSLGAIRYHLENSVHISGFCGDRDDTGLLSTLEALRALAPMADVRDGIIRCVKLCNKT